MHEVRSLIGQLHLAHSTRLVGTSGEQRRLSVAQFQSDDCLCQLLLSMVDLWRYQFCAPCACPMGCHGLSSICCLRQLHAPCLRTHLAHMQLRHQHLVHCRSSPWVSCRWRGGEPRKKRTWRAAPDCAICKHLRGPPLPERVHLTATFACTEHRRFVLPWAI